MATIDTNSVPFTKFREDLTTYLDRCVRFGERIAISRHAKDEAVLVSLQEWEEIAETLTVIGNPELFQQLVDSQRDINAGRYRSAEDVFADLDAED